MQKTILYSDSEPYVGNLVLILILSFIEAYLSISI